MLWSGPIRWRTTLKRAPPNIWVIRTSALSEHAYLRYFSTNPVAQEALSLVYHQLMRDPRAAGRRVPRDDPFKEHWVYESPRLPRVPKIRLYYIIEGRTVCIEALSLG